MTRRTRYIAGVVTTVVMIFSLAGTIWAATCMPASGPADAVVAAEDGMPACYCCLPAPNDERGDDERRCPFGPAASSQGCVIVTSLPARATINLGALAEADAPILGFRTEPELLLATSLFRPPKS